MNKFPWCLLCVMFLAACTNNQGPDMEPTARLSPTMVFNPYVISDGGFISGEPCGPPCFLGIIDTDDKRSVIKKLQERGAYTADCRVITYTMTEEISCLSYTIGFNLDNGTIFGVSFYPQDVALSDVIGKYGAPDYVWLYIPTDESGEYENYSDLELCYWDEKTTIILENQAQINSYNASPTTNVISVIYSFTPEAVCESPAGIPWHDYGIYQNP